MNEEFLKQMLSDMEAMNASVTPPSSREWELFRSAMAAESIRDQEVSESQMEVLILKILSSGRADGGEIAEELKKLKVHLATPGEGLIFALLARMEDEGVIIGGFNPEMTRKEYSLAERGRGLLERGSSTVQNLNPLVAALWAV